MKDSEIRVAALTLATTAFKFTTPKELIELALPLEDYIRGEKVVLAQPAFTSNELTLIKIAQESPFNFSHQLKIWNADKGLIPFTPSINQTGILDSTDRRVFADRGRQKGTTTALLIMALHTAIFNSHKHVVFMTWKFSAAKDAKKNMMALFESWPLHYVIKIARITESVVEFDNGSIIRFASTATNSLRGYSINTLIIDMVSYVSNADFQNMIDGVFPTVMSGETSKMLFATTRDDQKPSYAVDWLTNLENDFTFV